MSIQVQHRRDSRTNCEASTPAEGELWFDTTLKALRAGTGNVLGGILQKMWGRSYAISPPQITADEHDYAPADLAIAETVFVGSDTARVITGLAGGEIGARKTIVNRGGSDVTLANNSPASSAANRFMFESDIVLRPRAAIDLQYSAADSRWMRAGGGEKFLRVPEELVLAGVLTPPQITADEHDYAPAGVTVATTLRLSSDASREITGLADPRAGAIKTIVNVGGNPIGLKSGSGSSVAANRFDFGSDVTLASKQAAVIAYDGVDQRWKLLSATAGAAVAAGAVIAQTLAASALGPRVGMINGTITENHAGGAVTFAIKTLAGADPSTADPVLAMFQTGGGGYVLRSITSALAVTISSGSSLGAANAEPLRVWLVLIDTGSSVVLGAVKCTTSSGIMSLNEALPVSTTAEGGAGGADSAKTIYTTSALTSKYLCIAGFADYNSGLAAAGSWSVAPDRISLFGPGVARPGDVLQMVTMLDSNTSTTTSTSYVSTSTAVSLTPVSACNAVSVASTGNLRAAAGSAIAMVMLHRGSNDIGSACGAYAGGGLSTVGAALSAFDLPGAATAQTYIVKLRLDSAGTGYWGVTGPCMIEARELMG